MASRRHFINTSSQSSLLFRRLTAPNSSLSRPISSQKYSRETTGKESEERAPSTLEEFKRLSEEKAEMERLTKAKARQGFASQTVEKAEEGASAAMSDPKEEIVKEHYKECVGVGSFHKTGDDS